MATVLSTLYPPLIDTFMPAFAKEGPAKIQFTVPQYNSDKAISRIHVSLVDQYTNIKSFVNQRKFNDTVTKEVILNGILILSMTSSYISLNEETGIYTLDIPLKINNQSILAKDNSNFSTANYYKVQLRFDSTTSPESLYNVNSNYLINNRENFSEWSSVCLIKAISKPTLTLTNFDLRMDGTKITEQTNPFFNAGIIPIVGDVRFENDTNSNNKETLRSYEIKIYEKNHPDNILDSSGVIYTANQVDPNHIYWLAGAENANAGSTYVIDIDFTTKNQYTENKKYEFNIFNYDTTPFAVEWNFYRANLDRYNITTDGKIITEEDGIVRCTVTTTVTMPPGYLYIKRASSLDNFKKWELISCTKEQAGIVSRSFFDATVGSLVKYQYMVQYQLLSGALTTFIKSTDVIYPNFYNILLSRNGRQLAIRYNGDISSLKPIVNRQKIDTLGGKYPKFAENAQMNYKQFNISGLIDAESDFNRKFLDDRNYADEMNIYNSEMDGHYEIRNDTIADNEYAYPGTLDPLKVNTYKNTVHDIYPKNNWWWERKFREEAIKWLNDGEVKLFRSMPEGNMSVMLTDISLTPEKTLGRRLYNFTATMYEIEDGYSLETLNFLGIIDIVNEKENVIIDTEESDIETVTHYTIGQMYRQVFNIDNTGDKQADIINQTFNTSMSGGDTGIKGFDYTAINIGDWYKYIIYAEDSVLGSRYTIKPNSIVLKDVQIEFESKPTWWEFTTINNQDVINPVTELPQGDGEKVLALGYKIQLTIDEGEEKTINVFVNEKGFYQTPTNLKIIGLKICDVDAIATINYHIEYKTIYNSTTIPTTIQSGGKIVGQLFGPWASDTDISQEIKNKHNWNQVKSGKIVAQEFLQDWTALSLEVTPYTIFSMKQADDVYNDYVVGRTGIYNLTPDFDFEELHFLGRRMILSTEHEQNFLDEWEYVLDNSAQQNNINEAYSNIEQIKNPKYNTIYGIQDVNDNAILYKIYYIDSNWYNVSFLNNNKTIIIAKVPVYGMINYQGTLIKQTFK